MCLKEIHELTTVSVSGTVRHWLIHEQGLSMSHEACHSMVNSGHCIEPWFSISSHYHDSDITGKSPSSSGPISICYK